MLRISYSQEPNLFILGRKHAMGKEIQMDFFEPVDIIVQINNLCRRIATCIYI